MITSTQQSIANRILQQATKGTTNNPGLPQLLASFLVDQSAHETNGWTSGFFVNNNNCFGYACYPGSDWQDGCSDNKADNGVTVGNYDSIEDSVCEIVDWIYRRVSDGKFPSDLTSITTSDQYAQLLKNAGYYGDTESNYSAGLKRWATNLADFFKRHYQNIPR